ncbi:hypothetical protein [Maricaulis sp.]|uniref:hypothetical protein n=1 Tax=Maricaulis sp. TaxID=1486257 RepID=UPI00263352AA|nr:hypothetical protein [Maricaulis sp.]
MRTLACVLVSLSLATPVLAQDRFQANISAPATGSIEIGHIGFSDTLRSKADFLGQDELTRLAGYLREDLENALIGSSWHGISAQETVLTVTIVDVVPNRPTLSQIQQMDTAHYNEHVAGGADVDAALVNDTGDTIARFSFSWHNPDTEGGDGYGVWTDTRTAFARFAVQLAESLGEAPMPRGSDS